MKENLSEIKEDDEIISQIKENNEIYQNL